jgi:hypothetical protein
MDNRLRTTDIRLSGELTLRDAPFLTVPHSLQHFNPVEVVGNADGTTMTRTIKLCAAPLDDLQPLLGVFRRVAAHRQTHPRKESLTVRTPPRNHEAEFGGEQEYLSFLIF